MRASEVLYSPTGSSAACVSLLYVFSPYLWWHCVLVFTAYCLWLQPLVAARGGIVPALEPLLFTLKKKYKKKTGVPPSRLVLLVKRQPRGETLGAEKPPAVLFKQRLWIPWSHLYAASRIIFY